MTFLEFLDETDRISKILYKDDIIFGSIHGSTSSALIWVKINGKVIEHHINIDDYNKQSLRELIIGSIASIYSMKLDDSPKTIKTVGEYDIS